MNYAELRKIMTTLGWSCSRDSVGVDIFRIDGKNRYFTAIPNILSLPEGIEISFIFTVSNPGFDQIVSKISGKLNPGAILARMHPSGSRYGKNLGEQEVNECVKELLAWGEAQDIEKAIEERRQYLPAECHGARPLWHLAALARAGDIDKLEHYRRSFEKGDRLEFVPYITIDHIKRAIKVAKETQNKPLS